MNQSIGSRNSLSRIKSAFENCCAHLFAFFRTHVWACSDSADTTCNRVNSITVRHRVTGTTAAAAAAAG
jgi:hypothetical protein